MIIRCIIQYAPRVRIYYTRTPLRRVRVREHGRPVVLDVVRRPPQVRDVADPRAALVDGAAALDGLDDGAARARVAGVEGVEPIFSKSRASGLAGDPLMGNATRSRLYRMVRASGDLVTGQPMSEDDVQEFVTAFAPLGNHVVTQAFLDRALEGLPEETEDD